MDSLIGASVGAHRRAYVDFPAKLRGPGTSMAGDMHVYHEYKLCSSMYSMFTDVLLSFVSLFFFSIFYLVA